MVQSYLKSCALYDANVTPSLWTLANVAPVHTKQLYNLLHLGLGSNTMEGREQKHQQLQRYSENATYQDRWRYVFRHEYIQLIYLRENGFDTISYRKRGTKYIPEVCPGYCCCSLVLVSDSCQICDSIEMSAIIDELQEYCS